MKPLSRGDVRALVYRIATALFTAGNGERADRLVLVDASNKDLGGWCEASAKNQIQIAIDEFFEPEPTLPMAAESGAA